MYFLSGKGYRLPLLLDETLHLAGPSLRKTVGEKMGFDSENSQLATGVPG